MEPDAPPPAGGARAAAGNGAWLLSGQLVAKVAGLVFVVIVARAIGVREYGWFVFATSFVPLFLAFASLGLDSAVIRELARDRTRLPQVFASGLAVRVVAAAAALALAVALSPLFVESGLARVTVVVVGTALLLDEVTTYLSNVFKAFERMRFHAVALMVNRIGATLLALIAYVADLGLVVILVTYLLGSVGALAYCVVALRRHFPPIGVRAARRETALRLLRIGAPLGVAAVLNMALLRGNALMVQVFDGSTALGLYGVAFRFFESFLFVAWTLGSLTLPRYARQGRTPAAARTFDLAVSAALAFYVPLAVAALFVSRWAVSAAFGERYEQAAQAVPWLTAAAVLYAVTYQARNACVGVGARGAIARIALTALAVNVAVALVLIPRIGFEGAGIATAAASAVEALLSLLSLRRLGVPVRLSRAVSVPLLAGAAMAASFVVVGRDDGVAALLGLGVYGTVLVAAALVLTPEVKGGARSVLRRRAAAAS